MASLLPIHGVWLGVTILGMFTSNFQYHLVMQVPADGVVVRGTAAVDESMVTGESMPVFKEEGSEVIGATVSRKRTIMSTHLSSFRKNEEDKRVAV